MRPVISPDGTRLAWDREGSGPPVVFVPGVFNDRSRCAGVARQLASTFTVVTYDRRARGESSDEATEHTRTARVAREIDDLDAMIATVGGSAFVVGYSSGALLALAAAARGSAIERLAVYEPPFAHPGAEPRRPDDLPEQVLELIEAGRPGDAVALYQTLGIGIPAEVVDQMRHAPFWADLEAVAPSVVYDAVLAQEGTVTDADLRTITIPTLVLSGSETWDGLTRAADVVSGALPTAQRDVLDGGAGHDLDATPLAPALVSFFTA